jgi:hypothetical protein
MNCSHNGDASQPRVHFPAKSRTYATIQSMHEGISVVLYSGDIYEPPATSLASTFDTPPKYTDSPVQPVEANVPAL